MKNKLKLGLAGLVLLGVAECSPDFVSDSFKKNPNNQIKKSFDDSFEQNLYSYLKKEYEQFEPKLKNNYKLTELDYKLFSNVPFLNVKPEDVEFIVSNEEMFYYLLRSNWENLSKNKEKLSKTSWQERILYYSIIETKKYPENLNLIEYVEKNPHDEDSRQLLEQMKKYEKFGFDLTNLKHEDIFPEVCKLHPNH
jgi:hypothetical protein